MLTLVQASISAASGTSHRWKDNEEENMKKLIPAIAIAAIGIVSLAASPARADDRGEFREREHAPWSAPARPMPVPRAAPVRDYRHARWERDRWEAERARERRLLEERREAFYAH